MTNRTLSSAAAGFAHLFAARGATRAEEPKTDDQEARTARRAEEDDKRQEEDARRAEEDQRRQDEDAKRAEEDGDQPADKDKDDKDGKGAKGKGSKADDDDESCDEESDDDEKVRGAARKGRLAERARWTRALGHANAGGGRVGAACTLLATTEATSASVVATLGALGEPSRPSQAASLQARMSAAAPVHVGSDTRGGASGSLADKMKSAVEKVRPSRKG